MSPTRLLSLNGPDNVGKTTQIRLLSKARPDLEVLGSVHQHAPHLWSALPTETARWWFETSSTAELTRLLLVSHQLRIESRTSGGVAVLDRGHAMLVATAIATCVVKEGVSIDDARATVSDIQRALPPPPEEFAILLLISLRAEVSLAVSQQRAPTPWSPKYLSYQRVLHRVLKQQAERGVYDEVIGWDMRSPDAIQQEIRAVVDSAIGKGRQTHALSSVEEGGGNHAGSR